MTASVSWRLFELQCRIRRQADDRLIGASLCARDISGRGGHTKPSAKFVGLCADGIEGVRSAH
jgi:hypothetical protein